MNHTDSKHELELTTPGDREIVMKRVFDAPRARVFDAFTKPELIKRWLLGPDGWSMPICEVDLRVGGRYHYVWRNDADASEFGFNGAYREIDEPDRIVHVESMDGNPGEALVTTTFVERNGSTTVTMTIRHESREVRDMVIETGMAEGVGRSYQRLDDVLAG